MADQIDPGKPSTDAEQPLPETPQETPSVTPEPLDWRAALETADPKEVAKHPLVSGIAGTLAERQAQKAIQKALAERDAADAAKAKAAADQATAEAERQRQLQLARDEPYKLADEFIQRDSQTRADEARQQAEVAMLRQNAEKLIRDFGLDENDIKPIQGKTWPGTPFEGYNAFVKELSDIALHKGAQAAVDKHMTDWKAKIEEATRAAVLAETNGQEPAPDVSAGKAPAPRKAEQIIASQSEYEKAGKTPLERWHAIMGDYKPPGVN